jgi:predicted RNase H-like nuclease (RuvC/YqgF family)
MSINPDKDDVLDDEPTDELPILLETVVLDPAQHAVAGPGEQPAPRPPTGSRPEEPAAAEAAPRERAALARLATVEADFKQLTLHAEDLERREAENRAAAGQLERALRDARAELQTRRDAEGRWAAQVQDRERQVESLSQELDRARARVDAQARQLEELRRAAEAGQAELSSARQQLESSAARDAGTTAAPLEQQLREEIAALGSYIENRHAHWEDLSARLRESDRRVAELEQELEQRAERQRRAEQIAERERGRAARLRDDLTEAARTIESHERTLAAYRQAEPEAQRPAAEDPSPGGPPVEPPAASPPAPPAARDSDEAVAVVAQLEAELEHGRAELDRREADLADRAARLASADAELDSLREQLADAQQSLSALRGDLELERHDKARLESLLADRERRLEGWEHDLRERLSALQRTESSQAPTQLKRKAEKLRQQTTGDEPAAAPALICLTSEAPRTYPLNESAMTIGRSSQCDIQIFTQFVSREHARLLITRTGVVIEDLGSTNGVFVNSVRIDRQPLNHGDLVTIGETQFRFIESSAH